MKLAALILGLILGLGAPDGESAKRYLDALRERFSVAFVYDASLNLENVNAPDQVPRGTLNDCLDQLLAGTDILYHVYDKTVVLYRRIDTTDTLHCHDVINEARIRANRVFLETPGTVPIEPRRRVPMLLGESDPIKLALLSPGVTPAVEGSASMVVRGGETDGNLIMIDGVPLYNSAHLFGYLSVFDDDAISRIRLYKGHFPTRYEGRAASVIDAEGRDGARDRLRGVAGVGVLTDKLLLEGPIGSRTSFIVSGRFCGLGLLKSAFHAFENYGDYSYYDVYARISHILSDRDQLRLSFFSGKDSMRDTTAFGKWGTSLASLSWQHQFSSSTEGTAAVSFQQYNSGDNLFNSLIREWRASFDASTHKVVQHTFRYGGGYYFHDLLPTNVTSGHQRVHDFSAYAEDEWRNGRWTAVGGCHLNVFLVPEKAYFSAQPRLFLQFAPSPWRFFASAGRMVQPMHSLTSSQSVTLPSDLWVSVSGSVAPMTSDQISMGVEYGGKVNVIAEAWYRWMEGVLEYKDDRLGHIASGYWQNNVVSGEGYAEGLEIGLSGAPFWQLSYTLSRSMRRFDAIEEGAWFPSAHDHRHTIVLSLRKDLTEHIEVSGIWTWVSGGYMTVAGNYAFIMTPEGQFVQKPVYEGRNNYQLPATHHLDLGASFRHSGKRTEHSWTAGVYNAYAVKNPTWVVLSYGHETENGHELPLELQAISLFRMLPSFSYKLRF